MRQPKRIRKIIEMRWSDMKWFKIVYTYKYNVKITPKILPEIIKGIVNKTKCQLIRQIEFVF
jgi:hypothetical protein